MVSLKSPLKADLPEKDAEWYRHGRVVFANDPPRFSVILQDMVLGANGAIGIRQDGRWISSADPDVPVTLELQEPHIEDSDQLGTFTLITCRWVVAGVPVVTEVKMYNKRPILAFGIMFPEGLEGCATDDHHDLAAAFPILENHSSLGLVFAFTDRNFSQSMATFSPTPGPLVFFNENLDVAVLGPTRNFAESMIAPGTVNGVEGARISCGLEGNLEVIPAGVWHETLWVFGNGIRDTLMEWGECIRLMYGRQEPSLAGDLAISHLGIWHDNGGHYYYNVEEFGDYVKTFLAIKEEAIRKKIPYRYFHLDSWFYPKAPGRRGCLKWEPDPALLPAGIPALVERMGMPCMCHARYFDASTPYANQYKMVVEEHAAPAPAPSPQRWALVDDFSLWEHLMDNCVQWESFCYEQDWMISQWEFFEYLRAGWGRANKWLAEMSMAAQVRDLTIQYCMTPSNLLMAAVQFPNVTHVRVSGDYHADWRKDARHTQLTQTGMLAWALGIVPYSDVQKSSTNPTEEHPEEYPLMEVLLATLSCGPVGFGDQVGHQDPAIIRQSCRPDGLLLKPDYPLHPWDQAFVSHAAPYWMVTESVAGYSTWYYVMVVNFWPDGVETWTTSLAALGKEPTEKELVLYDYRARTARSFSPSEPFGTELADQDFAYYVVAPAFPGEFALLGFADKVAMMSAQAIVNFRVTGRSALAVINWVPGTEVHLLVYNPPGTVTVESNPDCGIEVEKRADSPLVTVSYLCSANRTELIFKW